MGGDPKPMGIEGKICLSFAGIAGLTVLILSLTYQVEESCDHPMYFVYKDLEIG